MMKRAIPLLMLASLFTLSCGSDDPGAPQDPPGDDPIASESVDADGGVLETDDVSLSIPAGAFSGLYDLELYSSETISELEGEGGETKYLLKGLPEDYAEPLRIGVRRNGPLYDDNFILCGGKDMEPGFSDSSVAYLYLSAADSSGFLVAHLPPISEMASNARTGMNAATWGSRNGIPLLDIFLSPAPGHHTQYESAHFKFLYHSDLEDDLLMVATMAEGYLDIVGNDYFSFADVPWVWPVTVSFDGRGHADTRVLVFDFTGPPYIDLYDNWVSQGQVEELNQTIGAAMFWLGLYTHYPNQFTFESKAHYWLTAAVTTWSEELFTSDPAYVRPVFFNPGYVAAPFEGLRKTEDYVICESECAWRHGRYLTPVIKFLMDEGLYSIAGLQNTYQAIKLGTPPIDAFVDNVTGDITDWWPRFFRSFVAGEIYGIESALFDEHLHARTWIVDDATDTQRVFSSTDPYEVPFGDVSARRYLVDVTYTDIPETMKMILTATGDAAGAALSVLAFQQNGEAWAFLDQADGAGEALEIGGLRDYVDQGRGTFLVVVVNSETSSASRASDIDLEIRIEPDEEPEEWTYTRCEFQIRFLGSYVETHSGGTTEYDEGSTWCNYEAIGEFTGNTFEGVYDALGFITGSLTVTVSDLRDRVTYFSWTEDYESQFLTATSSVVGFDIQAHDYLTGYFRVQDEATCAHITSMYHLTEWPNLTRALVDSTCNDDSYIAIRFSED